MRRSLSFACHGAAIQATLDEGVETTAILVVTGGTEIRSGAHGGLAQLAARLAAAGYPVLRYDRRGVGDSEGDDPGFAGSGPDIAAADDALRTAVPAVRRVIGLGLCDGATALALHHRAAGISGLILINPWVIEPAAGLPPPAAIRRRYAERLLSLDGWKRLLTGGVRYGKILRGLRSIMSRKAPGALEAQVAAALRSGGAPIELLIARRDPTAVAFMSAWRGRAFAAVRDGGRARMTEVETRSHSFARGDEPATLAALCLAAVARLTPRP